MERMTGKNRYFNAAAFLAAVFVFANAFAAPTNSYEYLLEQPDGAVTTIKGVVLFVSFPDFPAPNNADEYLKFADSAYNQPNFRGGVGESIYDYFDYVSNGSVQYTNHVMNVFIELPQNSAHYNSSIGIIQLVTDALTILRDDPAYADARREIVNSVTTYLRRPNGSLLTDPGLPTATALNIHTTRSGADGAGWFRSQRGFYNGGIRISDGEKSVGFYDYQITHLSSLSFTRRSINRGTTIHENFHMLFNWPDLYPYVSPSRNFIGAFCIMSSAGDVLPNPVSRSRWMNVIDIADMGDTLLTLTVDSRTVYRYRRNEDESFWIEIRRKAGHDADIPGEGLVIWHLHNRGSNTQYQVGHSDERRRIPWLAVIQADANNGAFQPVSTAPFVYGRNSTFNRYSTPAARYHAFGADPSLPNLWAGEFSDINITEISALDTINNSMTFRIGGVVPTSVKAAGGTPPAFTIRANSAGNVTFQVGKRENVSIRVYDVRGRVVATLYNGVKNPGSYNMNISASRGANLGKGLYIVRMQSESFSKSVKVHYLK